LSRDNLRYPSSTQILGVFVDFDKIPAHILSYATERGQLVHRICSVEAEGLPYYGKIPSDSIGYILSFRQWLEVAVDEVVLVEKRLYDDDLGYCGQPDLVVRMKGDDFLSVPDLKTPKAVQRIWRGQLASYLSLVKKAGYDARRAFSVRLRDNGALPIIDEYTDDARDMAAFISALTAYKYFKGD